MKDSNTFIDILAYTRERYDNLRMVRNMGFGSIRGRDILWSEKSYAL